MAAAMGTMRTPPISKAVDGKAHGTIDRRRTIDTDRIRRRLAQEIAIVATFKLLIADRSDSTVVEIPVAEDNVLNAVFNGAKTGRLPMSELRFAGTPMATVTDCVVLAEKVNVPVK